jgi:hypothetical protein
MRKPKEPNVKSSNLLKIFDRLNHQHFGGLICGGIGWRWIPMGAEVIQALCMFDERFIRVSTVMDDTRIPLWYLEFVVYHEMLHLHHGPQQYSESGYDYPHDERFLCMEMKHPNYQRALDFEANKLPKVISSWREWREWQRKAKKSTTRLPTKRR